MTRFLRTLLFLSLAPAFIPGIAATQATPTQATPAQAKPAQAKPALSTLAKPLWVASWAASQQIPEPANALPSDDLRDATLRQIVHLSVGGPSVRVHLSNAFGVDALHFTSVHIAHPLSPASPAIDPATDIALTFTGKSDVTIPPGAEFLSDPVNFTAAPLSDLAVTFHLDAPPAVETSHPGSRATSYFVHGDLVSAPDFQVQFPVDSHGLVTAGDCKPGSFSIDGQPAHPAQPACSTAGPLAKHIDHWYQLAGVDVLASAGAASIVALGDSITDGHGATTNGNDRWTDVLAARLANATPARAIGVSNQGIGGNHLLTDGLGPNVLARFDRDVLAQAGVRWLIVFEGVNDLGGLARNGEVPAEAHADLVVRILAAYQQIILRAHAHGIRVFGATITPYTGSDYYHPDAESEADRQAVNAWIRAPGHFDAVIDFDAVVRDPAHPDHLLPAFDCGDHLHPSPAGYRAMGNAIPLELFTQ
jgi:lysophospholipase L1-like esterase